MASRTFLARSLRAAQPLELPSTMLRKTPRFTAQRGFQSSARMMETPVNALPARRPVGAFRGGLLGFLAGSVTAGTAMYYYVVEEYRVSNELLTEDIYNLQTVVQRVEGYVKSLEDRVDAVGKKK